MGRLLCSVGQYAEKPYQIPQVGISVYCIEELCYALYKNAFVLDTEIMDTGMAKWLDQECGVADLASQLYALKNQKGSPGAWVGIILDYAHFGTELERRTVTQLFAESADMDQDTKKKNKADYLLKNHKYAKAISEYDKLLLHISDEESVKKALIIHNKGIGLCRMFRWKEAAELFLKACGLDGTRPEYELHYLGALRMDMSQADYIAFIAEHPLWHTRSLEIEKQLDDIEKEFEVTQDKIETEDKTTYYTELSRVLSEEKTAYREMSAESPQYASEILDKVEPS